MSLSPMLKELHLSAYPRTIEEVDAAFRAIGQPDQARRSWRVLRDPAFAELVARYGEEALAPAGFYDDGSPLESVLDPQRGADQPHLSPLPPTWTAPAGVRPAALLVMTGCFAPPHLGHVGALRTAKLALEDTHEVRGAWMSPSHDSYVRSKPGGDAYPAALRLQLCALAAADDPWIEIDSWEALGPSIDINYTEVLHRAHALVAAAEGAPSLWYVAGSDNAGFALALTGYGCVIIERAEHTWDDICVRDPLLAHRLQELRDSGRVKWVSLHHNGMAGIGASSSAVRAGQDDLLHPRVFEALQRRSEHGEIYAVRDDLEWALSRVNHPQLETAVAQFRSRVTQLLQRAFKAQVILIDVARQRELLREHLRERPAATVVLLDMVLRGQRLGFDWGRQFTASGAQLTASELVQRPGTRSEAGLPLSGDVCLIDDDVASGWTMRAAAAKLGLDTYECMSLLDLSMQDLGLDKLRLLDIVDLRDMLIGAPHSGLIVMRAGWSEPARSVYLPPYVNLMQRMKVPVSEADNLASGIWAASCELWNQVPIAAGELGDQAVRSIALWMRDDPDDVWGIAQMPMSHVCRLITRRHPRLSRNDMQRGSRGDLGKTLEIIKLQANTP